MQAGACPFLPKGRHSVGGCPPGAAPLQSRVGLGSCLHPVLLLPPQLFLEVGEGWQDPSCLQRVCAVSKDQDTAAVLPLERGTGWQGYGTTGEPL